ncbi:hypothetical protein AGMMS49960_01850 [Betaproteobacteria bacterium]|nr:hypothetical protein AGMMS49543_27800 [Betaproteobacteria bacterium]GHT98555.1 hypothetical protein AGMMS49960_01850 [Betaproteobacteria bacterium]GHU16911.1 hypothetical protein AGMMS50243_04190 [Betaproteobacteria bacterium]GHV87630.1 hypothetical protein AGMMS50255_9260 [Spirochaetia bacterium]
MTNTENPFSGAAKNPDVKARRRVSYRRRDTPAGVLRALAGDRDIDVRINVALHPNTPTNVLQQLASDPNGTVREQVARNPGTPPEVLAVLALDLDSDVQEAAREALGER